MKDRILQGAHELFLRYGVKAITMDDISKHLGISKKTIYQFFDNKDQLVCVVTELHLDHEETVMLDIAEKAADPVQELLLITEHFRTAFQNMNSSLLYEIEKYFPKAWKIYLEHKQNCIQDTIVNTLNKGVNEGLFRKEMDVEVMAALRLEEIQLGFNPLIFAPAKFDLSEVHFQLLDHFLHGICTLKGHKLINKYKQITEEE